MDLRVRKTLESMRWPAIVPACARAQCNGGTKWNLLRRRTGIRFEQRWYCSPECVEVALQAVLSVPAVKRMRSHRLPLGLLLVSRGAVEPGALQAALRAQQAKGRGRIGEWLRAAGAVAEPELTRAVAQQAACPVYPVDHAPAAVPGIAPAALQRRHRVLPVRWSEARNTLWLAFDQPVMHGALRAFAQVLGCHVEACIIGEAEMQNALAQLPQARTDDEVVLSGISNEREIAAVVRSYANQWSADEVRAARCGDDVWIRLMDRDRRLDLLFEGDGRRAFNKDAEQ